MIRSGLLVLVGVLTGFFAGAHWRTAAPGEQIALATGQICDTWAEVLNADAHTNQSLLEGINVFEGGLGVSHSSKRLRAANADATTAHDQAVDKWNRVCKRDNT